jgi:micrococcal nuclease
MRFVVACVAAALLSPTGCTVAHADTTTADVLRVVDGDTIDIRDDVRGRLRVRIRFLGIDTPETKKPGFTVGCWGPQATQFAKDTLIGQQVAVIADPTQDRVDRYGRTYLH